jgi:hypothetical protein
MKLGPPSSCFFFNGGPKKALSLSLDVKCDQQTHEKMMPPIMASNSRKSSNKVPIIIFQMLLAGRRTHNNRFFMRLRGFLWVWIMGSQNVMGSDYGSNISVCVKKKAEYRKRDL